MWDSLINAVVVMTGILGVWLIVQGAWRKVFSSCPEREAAACIGWNCNGCEKKRGRLSGGE